jgi:hypothetical protein
MQPPLFRFTLGQLAKLIAGLAIFFVLLRPAGWPWTLAIGLMLLGFAVDRAWGGPGIVGSMLAGAIALLGLGPIGLVHSPYSTPPGSNFSSARSLLVNAAFFGMIGLALGACIGDGLWLIAVLLGIEPGAEPSSARPITSRGLGDRRPEHPKAGGHWV